MGAGDLTTLAAVRAYLRGSVPVPQEDEALLESLITSVSKAFVSLSGNSILSAGYVDTWSGDGSTIRFLTQYPVTAVAAVLPALPVMVDGAAIPVRPAIGSDGWVLTDGEIGRLELIGYTFTTGVSNCSVTYTAGLGATAPADVDQAVVDQVAFQYKAKDRIGITNESTSAGGSVTYTGGWKAQTGEDGMTPLFAATVERYRRVC